MCWLCARWHECDIADFLSGIIFHQNKRRIPYKHAEIFNIFPSMFSNMTVLILINYTSCLTHSSHYCFKCRFVSFSFYKALFIIIIFYYLIINVEIFNQYFLCEIFRPSQFAIWNYCMLTWQTFLRIFCLISFFRVIDPPLADDLYKLS